MSTNIELEQPDGLRPSETIQDAIKDKSKCNRDCLCAVVSCGMIAYEIYDIVSDSMTTHKYGQGELSKHYNMFVYIVHMVFTIIGSLLAVPKIALQSVDIATGFCGMKKRLSKRKAERCVNFAVLLLEALPQAVIAEFYLDVCAEKKFYGALWVFASYVACNIASSCISLFSFFRYLWKHRREDWKMNVLCAVGIALGLATLGFSVAALSRDFEVTCLAWKNIKPRQGGT